MGSSDDSARMTARRLTKKWGIAVDPFSKLDKLIAASAPDAIIISTPPHLHFQQIITAFDHNIPVLCEKPLFWHPAILPAEIEQKLAILDQHANRKIMVNTCNASFIDPILPLIDRSEDIASFALRFQTNGPHTGRQIAADLLPHGLSLLIKLLGVMEIKTPNEFVAEQRWRCKFTYGCCNVEFDFQESPAISKAFLFSIDGRQFERIQEGFAESYRVFLVDSLSHDKIELEDPFKIYVSRFISCCLDPFTDWEALAFDAFANLRLMSALWHH